MSGRIHTLAESMHIAVAGRCAAFVMPHVGSALARSASVIRSWSALILSAMIATLSGTVTALAQGDGPFDVGAKVGTAAGSITFVGRRQTGVERTYRYSDLSTALVLYRDIAEHVSAAGQIQIVIDPKSRDVMRKGVDGTLAYHLVGGSRRYVSDHGTAGVGVEGAWPYAVSLALQGGYDQYDATDRLDTTRSIGLALVTIMAGAQARYDLSPRDAVGFEALTAVLRLGTGGDTLRAATLYETSLFWRMLL